jgi:hypothetical protein
LDRVELSLDRRRQRQRRGRDLRRGRRRLSPLLLRRRRAHDEKKGRRTLDLRVLRVDRRRVVRRRWRRRRWRRSVLSGRQDHRLLLLLLLRLRPVPAEERKGASRPSRRLSIALVRRIGEERNGRRGWWRRTKRVSEEKKRGRGWVIKKGKKESRDRRRCSLVDRLTFGRSSLLLPVLAVPLLVPFPLQSLQSSATPPRIFRCEVVPGKG